MVCFLTLVLPIIEGQRVPRMNIGQASKAAGVSAKMIRHYESIGLLRPALRSTNDYRQYADHDVHELVFIRRARQHGFPLTKYAACFPVARSVSHECAEVKRIAASHLANSIVGFRTCARWLTNFAGLSTLAKGASGRTAQSSATLRSQQAQRHRHAGKRPSVSGSFVSYALAITRPLNDYWRQLHAHTSFVHDRAGWRSSRDRICARRRAVPADDDPQGSELRCCQTMGVRWGALVSASVLSRIRR